MRKTTSSIRSKEFAEVHPLLRSFTTTFSSSFPSSSPQSSSQLHADTVRRHDGVDVSGMEDYDGDYTRPTVQWYPGHIAKAERELSETLKAVDVVVEVRDARVCKATAHPRVGEWCAGRPRIVVLTHLDMVPRAAFSSWRNAYERLGAERWDEAPINTQVANQAQQARDIRIMYDTGSSISRGGKRKPNQSATQSPVTSSIRSSNRHNVPSNVSPVEQVLFVNAKQGQGIHALHRAIIKAGAHVQERRERRGLNPRALRVGIIGYPNVGKSALINKILGRKRARTANTPGVTRTLQWIRVRADDKSSSGISKEFELLDSPGIIPAKMVDQSDALLLAACNCIGQAAYDNQAVAAYLCEWLKAIHLMDKQHLTAPEWRTKCKERYGFDPLMMIDVEETGLDGSNSEGATRKEYITGEDMLFKVADNTCRGDPEDAARKILQDFRTGRMGPISLQLAPETEEDNGQLSVSMGDLSVSGRQDSSSSVSRSAAADDKWQQQMQGERARAALETAKERGLELPPMVNTSESQDDAAADAGKGMFDGW